VKKELQKLDLMIVQDLFLTETAELADVVCRWPALPKRMERFPIPNAAYSACAKRSTRRVKPKPTGSHLRHCQQDGLRDELRFRQGNF
jgi:hypothetical protein